MVCGKKECEDEGPMAMVLCDGKRGDEPCSRACHVKCDDMECVPKGEWYCSRKCEYQTTDQHINSQEGYSNCKEPRSKKEKKEKRMEQKSTGAQQGTRSGPKSN